MKRNYFFKILLVTVTLFTTCDIYAETVYGEGVVQIGAGDAVSIRNASKQAAIRDAVLKAIKDATALDASSQKFAPIVDEIAKQIGDIQVKSETREGANFVTRIQVDVDRRQIKNAVRGTDLDKLNDRSFTILALIDEFVTNTRDLNTPLMELVEYSSDKGSSFSNQSLNAASASTSNSSSLAATKNADIAAARQTKISGSSAAGYAESGYAGSASAASATTLNGSDASALHYKEKDSLAAESSSSSKASMIDKKDIRAASHDKVSFKKLVQYQDHSQPTTNPIFSNAFLGNMRDYDLKFQDSSIAKSKFFGDTPIRLSTLENSTDLAKFADFARSKSNSDFLLIGSSTVISGGVNSATGQMDCVVNVTIKAFSTSDSELIASDTQGVQASGSNIEACAQNASKKIADMMSPEFAGRILGYWSDRSARGREFIVELKGNSLPFPMRMAFQKAIKEIKNVKFNIRSSDNNHIQMSVTVKGDDDPQGLFYSAITAQSAFSSVNLDGKIEGTAITFCIDKCSSEESKSNNMKKKK